MDYYAEATAMKVVGEDEIVKPVVGKVFLPQSSHGRLKIIEIKLSGKSLKKNWILK